MPPSPKGSRQPLIFQSVIGHEDRAVCGSPRRERSVNALCSWGDCNHADREFGFADLVLIALAQTAKPSAIRSQRLCFRPKPAVQPHEHSAWQGLTGPEGAPFQPQPDEEKLRSVDNSKIMQRDQKVDGGVIECVHGNNLFDLA